MHNPNKNPEEPIFKPQDARKDAEIEDEIDEDATEPGVPTFVKDEEDIIPDKRDKGPDISDARSIAEPMHMRDDSREGSDLKHEEETHPD